MSRKVLGNSTKSGITLNFSENDAELYSSVEFCVKSNTVLRRLR